jgi:hypothetical protein
VYLKNNYIVKGDITEVKLNCKGEEVVAIIDTEDFPKIDSFPGKWYGFQSGNTVYALTVNGKETVSMHRVIMQPKKTQLVDHKSRNGLDNRKINLRVCSRGQNNQNKNLAKNNTSGYRGVSLYKPNGKWIARIMVDRKSIPLGYFNTPEEANEAVLAAREAWMPFSNDLPGRLAQHADELKW